MNEEGLDLFDALEMDMSELERRCNQDSDVEGTIKKLIEVNGFYQDISEIEKRAKKLLTNLKQVVVPTLFEEKDVKTISMKGYRFTVTQTYRASIQGGMKEDAFAWLRENELGDLITETVNAQTLSSAAKALLDEGIDLDPDLFNAYYQNNTSITKVK